MPNSVWTEKEERQYQHIKEATGSKKEAAATVNKLRAEHGETKKDEMEKTKDMEKCGACGGTGLAKKMEKADLAPGTVLHGTPGAMPVGQAVSSPKKVKLPGSHLFGPGTTGTSTGAKPNMHPASANLGPKLPKPPGQ